MSYQPIPTSVPDHRAAPNIAGFLHANTPTLAPSIGSYEAADDMGEYASQLSEAQKSAARTVITDANTSMAFAEAFEELKRQIGEWKPTARQSAQLEFVVSVEERSIDLATHNAPAKPTPNGKLAGVAIDAIAALQSILAIAEERVSIPTYIRLRDIANPILQRAGVRS